MQKDNKFFEDIAKMASGAAGGFMEMRREIDSMIATQTEKLLQKMHLATREEVATNHEMLVKARTEQEELKKRVETLEGQVAQLLSRHTGG